MIKPDEKTPAWKGSVPKDVLDTQERLLLGGGEGKVLRYGGAWWVLGTMRVEGCSQVFSHDVTRSVLHLERISTPQAERGRGLATQMFARIFAAAGDLGAVIRTNGLTQDPKGFPQDALIAWYGRIGLSIVHRPKRGAVMLERKPAKMAA